MTQVRLPRNDRTAASEQESSSEPSPDTPLPSIESPASPRALSTSNSASSQNGNAFRTPSISVSPPPQSSLSQSAGSQNAQLFDPAQSQSPTANGIADGISQLQLIGNDPLSNLQDLGTALEPVNGNPVPSTPGVAEAAFIPVPSQRRRRSSSRTVMQPYDVTAETPPDDKFNAEAFQRHLNNTKGLVSDLKAVLGSSALHQQPGSKMNLLHKDAARLVNFQFPASRIVGFVGDSGAGKSSVLNCLLDKPDLVRTSNGGQACTCVVTEFHYHGHDFFSIDVQLFGVDELLEQLRPMLSIYRENSLQANETLSQEEREHLETGARLAGDTFKSMFPGSPLLDEGFLLNEDENEVLRRFRVSITNTIPTITNGIPERLTLEDCIRHLSRLSCDPADDEPAKWPYIRKIRVNLNSYILSRGLILVDLPGLRDLNSARQNITERFLVECNEIFAVCPIGRATTDKSVQDVFDLANRARMSNVSVICTKSDDTNARESMAQWGGERALRIAQLQDYLDAANADVDNFRSEIDEYAGYDDLSPEESADLACLISQRAAAERAQVSHNFQLQEFLINTRNNIVSQQISQHYTGTVDNQIPRVFCVGNTMYRENRYLDTEISRQYLRLSGIPNLRQYCISIVSDNQHRIATRFMRHDVPRLLNDIDLWLQSGADTFDAEQRANAIRAMNGLEERLISNLLGSTSYLPTVSRVLRDRFKVDIHQVSGQNIPRWSTLAQAASSEWDGWHHATYAAFCRHYGRYDSRAIGFHDWNEEVMEGMADDLTGPWQSLGDALLQRQGHVTGSITVATDGGVEFLEAELSHDLDRRLTLSRALRDHCSFLHGAVITAFDDAEQSFRILGINALSSLRTSFIGDGMEATYRDCNAEYGAGSDRRRKAVMRRTLSNQGLFSDMMIRLRNEFRRIANALQTSIDNAVDIYRQNVTGTLDLVRDENTAIESQQDPVFHNRVSDALRNISDAMQVIEDEVPELE